MFCLLYSIISADRRMNIHNVLVPLALFALVHGYVIHSEGRHPQRHVFQSTGEYDPQEHGERFVARSSAITYQHPSKTSPNGFVRNTVYFKSLHPAVATEETEQEHKPEPAIPWSPTESEQEHFYQSNSAYWINKNYYLSPKKHTHPTMTLLRRRVTSFGNQDTNQQITTSTPLPNQHRRNRVKISLKANGTKNKGAKRNKSVRSANQNNAGTAKKITGVVPKKDYTEQILSIFISVFREYLRKLGNAERKYTLLKKKGNSITNAGLTAKTKQSNISNTATNTSSVTLSRLSKKREMKSTVAERNKKPSLGKSYNRFSPDSRNAQVKTFITSNSRSTSTKKLMASPKIQNRKVMKDKSDAYVQGNSKAAKINDSASDHKSKALKRTSQYTPLFKQEMSGLPTRRSTSSAVFSVTRTQSSGSSTPERIATEISTPAVGNTPSRIPSVISTASRISSVTDAPSNQSMGSIQSNVLSVRTTSSNASSFGASGTTPSLSTVGSSSSTVSFVKTTPSSVSSVKTIPETVRSIGNTSSIASSVGNTPSKASSMNSTKSNISSVKSNPATGDTVFQNKEVGIKMANKNKSNFLKVLTSAPEKIDDTGLNVSDVKRSWNLSHVTRFLITNKTGNSHVLKSTFESGLPHITDKPTVKIQKNITFLSQNTIKSKDSILTKTAAKMSQTESSYNKPLTKSENINNSANNNLLVANSKTNIRRIFQAIKTSNEINESLSEDNLFKPHDNKTSDDLGKPHMNAKSTLSEVNLTTRFKSRNTLSDPADQFMDNNKLSSSPVSDIMTTSHVQTDKALNILSNNTEAYYSTVTVRPLNDTNTATPVKVNEPKSLRSILPNTSYQVLLDLNGNKKENILKQYNSNQSLKGNSHTSYFPSQLVKNVSEENYSNTNILSLNFTLPEIPVWIQKGPEIAKHIIANTLKSVKGDKREMWKMLTRLVEEMERNLLKLIGGENPVLQMKHLLPGNIRAIISRVYKEQKTSSER